MSETGKTSDLSARVEQEHEHLGKELDELREYSSQPASGEEFGQWRLELIWRLRDFKNDLLKHFDLEEEGGFMRDVRQMVPNSAPQVSELLNEHRQMEQVIDAILRHIKNIREKDDSELGRLQQEIASFAATIFNHETTERHLLQRTYYRDYGGPE